jgi:hypothetical protein
MRALPASLLSVAVVVSRLSGGRCSEATGPRGASAGAGTRAECSGRKLMRARSSSDQGPCAVRS